MPVKEWDTSCSVGVNRFYNQHMRICTCSRLVLKAIIYNQERPLFWQPDREMRTVY